MAEKTTIEEHKEKLKRINDVFKLIKEKDVRMIDLRFTDLPGQWQHLTIPVSKLSESTFYESDLHAQGKVEIYFSFDFFRFSGESLKNIPFSFCRNAKTTYF